jgi:hypothetical protein
VILTTGTPVKRSMSVETARANGIKPSRYMRYLSPRFRFARSREDYLALTPHDLDQAEFRKLSV